MVIKYSSTDFQMDIIKGYMNLKFRGAFRFNI